MRDVLILLLFVVMIVGAVNAAVRHHADKLEFGVPWLQWLSFEEIVALGHSRFWISIILPMFYRKGRIEIRISDKISSEQRTRADNVGLLVTTVELYEYKFTEQWRRGKEKPDKREHLIPQLLPV